MILADVRHRLTRDDAQLVVRLLSSGVGDAADRSEERLRDQGIDALLDDPRLLSAMIERRQGMHASFPLFAYVVIRHALLNMGEPDRGLADYVAAILVHFGVAGRATRIADTDDDIYDTLASLCEDLDDPDARRSFLVRQHLGNYALWLSGLFPDWIEARRWRRGGPHLEYYEEVGRRGFKLAADHTIAQQHGLTALFAGAAERFPMLRGALNQVSDVLLFPACHSPERLMRQVRDEARWRLSS
ncbi:MAG TPA: hypothetical protein VMM18_07915 [Gemmatimonadaceae bacterium]|nr:hypothetical protein [Gemmatimonadaceae bacterium]